MTEPREPEYVARPKILIGELLQDFADRFHSAELQGEVLESVVTELAQTISTLTDRVADLEEQLSAVQRLFTEQREDLASEHFLAHLGLGKEYTILVTQRFFNLAQQLAGEDDRKSALDTAQTVADLCWLLFSQAPPQPGDVLDALSLAPDHDGAQGVLQVVASATALRGRAEAMPDHVMWDFSIEPGSPVNDHQKPWAHCDPDHPVRLVVAPAFRVNGAIIERQLVYTSAQPVELRPRPVLGGPGPRKIWPLRRRGGLGTRRRRRGLAPRTGTAGRRAAMGTGCGRGA